MTSSGTSTSTTTVDPTTGATVTSYTSTTTYVNPQTGKAETSTSSSTTSSHTDPTTGATVSVSKSDYTYYDPITKEQKSSSSTSESTYNSATGQSESKTSGDWGTSYSYYDPTTGVSKSESSWVDTRTGETHTSTSESSSRTETDPATGATVTIYESKYSYTNPETGASGIYTSTSSSKSITNADGSTTYVSDNTYVDPLTGKEVTSKSESTYNPQTGTSVSITKTVDPETGEEVVTGSSESKYDSTTGESYSKYTYTDPTTGKTYTSESSTTKDEDGNYVSEYKYVDEDTGEVRETPYYGVFGGGSGNAHTYSDSTGSYTYQYEGSPPEDVRTYITPDGSTYVYTDTTDEQNALSEAYGETFAAAVDSNLQIGVVEHDLLEEHVPTEEVTRELIGEQVIPYTDFVQQIEARSDGELTEGEHMLVTQEYENFEERLVTAGEEPTVDVSPETYGQYNELYETYNLPKEDRSIKSAEDFQFTVDLRDEFYTKRSELYTTTADLQPEERAQELRALEEDYAQKYQERLGKPASVEPISTPGELSAISDESLPALTPDSIELMIREQFGPEFQKLTDSGIPPEHPQWKALENQVGAKRDELLQKQETVLVTAVIASCQDSVGGSSESCGQKAQAVSDIVNQCGIGSSGAACQEAAQIVAVQLGCESSSDKNSCSGETVRILSEVKERTNDEST
ncbi:hypothetical protein HZC07_00225, partial [Candidatus Micrarchaeota archaeon]|nr:hypothetical protein [Candidatus Micrarchaeota archaeon]